MKLPNPRFGSIHLYTDYRADKYGIFVDEDAAILMLIDLVFVVSFIVLCVIALVRFW